MYRLIKSEILVDSWSIPIDNITEFLNNSSLFGGGSKTFSEFGSEDFVVERAFSHRCGADGTNIGFGELFSSERTFKLHFGDILNIKFLNFFDLGIELFRSLTPVPEVFDLFLEGLNEREHSWICSILDSASLA